MAEDILVIPGGKLIVTRMVGPASEGSDRRRYQLTIYGQTDNWGQRYTWCVPTRSDARLLLCALEGEDLGVG